MKLIAAAHIEDTVDTLKFGSSGTEVRGVATTFMASQNVLRRARNRGLNLIIAHEGPFYSHRDQLDILQNDPVYRSKLRFLENDDMAIFRLHDHIHRNNPDGIVDGLIRDLEWESYVDEMPKSGLRLPLKTSPLTIPNTTLREVAEYVKAKLNAPFVRVVGDPAMACSRVGLLPGYCGGGALAIPFFQNEELDVIITGEGPEWETPEYVRDAVFQGRHKALIVLGHGKSEESGMKYLVDSLKPMFPTIPMEFIGEEPLFQIV
jgi:putative NIF3 family GTP cyclohydrolase 1 type 2